MIVFWTTVRSAVFLMIVSHSEPNWETILKARETFAGVLSWLADWGMSPYSNLLRFEVFCWMWAKIITIKTTKDLNYFRLCAFELNYWNKWTFPRHSNVLRCTCINKNGSFGCYTFTINWQFDYILYLGFYRLPPTHTSLSHKHPTPAPPKKGGKYIFF